MNKVAIIGAGLAGLVLAKSLSRVASVKVFEKSFKLGGRLTSTDQSGYEFDHGAQFFIAKTPVFDAWVADLKMKQVVAVWHARFADIRGQQVKNNRQWDDAFPHYVGVPNMLAIAEHLSQHLPIQRNITVTSIVRNGRQWQLYANHEVDLGCYDWVVSTAPSAQTQHLMQPHILLQDQLLSGMQPCYTLMLGLHSLQNTEWDVACIKESDLSWISLNHTKPGRVSTPTLVVMSSNAWAAQHIDADESWVIEAMLSRVLALLPIRPSDIRYTKLKKWRYANAQKVSAQYGLDLAQQLAYCGDWCVSGRVESAYLSAMQLAEVLTPHLKPTT